MKYRQLQLSNTSITARNHVISCINVWLWSSSTAKARHMVSSGIRQPIFNKDRTKLRTDTEGDIGKRIWRIIISRYVYVKQFTVESGHKSPQPICAMLIAKAPPRMQRFRLKVQKYDTAINLTPWKYLEIADVLFRIFHPHLPDDELNLESQVQIDLNDVPISDDMLRTLQQVKTKFDKK